MPILKMIPAYKDYIWGGTKLLTDYNKAFDGNRLAETWELSCHPEGPSVIANGMFAGRTLREYISIMGFKVLGSNCQIFQDFPILVKLIDARDNLSIQVHPDNIYALENEQQYGKTEMWVVLEAGPGAFLYYGFKHEISKNEFKERIQNGTLLEVLNAVPVHPGDMFYIPAGTLHSIGKNMLIAEIQQNSNVTYRVYDYDRVGADGMPRKLHVDQALEVTHCCPPRMEYNFGGHLARCAYFTVDIVDAPFEGDCDEESFTSILIVDGEGTLTCEGEEMECRKGDSFFLPACSGEYRLDRSLRGIVTRVGTI